MPQAVYNQYMTNMYSSPLITIIVPVYNVEKQLPFCVNSLLKQTYKNIEILLIDDGSTDASGKMIDDYQTAFTQITAYHQTNQGAATARNFGLDKAQGQYIVFVDSDDYVGDEYIQYLWNLKNIHDSDTVCCRYIQVQGHDECFHNMAEDVPVLLTNKQACFYMFRFGKGHELAIVTGKLFNARLFEFIRFDDGYRYEDEGITYKLLFDSNHITFGSKQMYAYYDNEKGVMHNENRSHVDDLLVLIIHRICFFHDKGQTKLALLSELELIFLIIKKRNLLDEKGNIRVRQTIDSECTFCYKRLLKFFLLFK